MLSMLKRLFSDRPRRKPVVSMLMLTHNAPHYVEQSIRTIRENTPAIAYELIVVDNASDEPTRSLVKRLHNDGLIDRLKLSDRNTLFAEGNNTAARLACPDATHFLLVNSDIAIRRDDWLAFLLANHRRGATSFGAVTLSEPQRADGWCLLIDADLYQRYGLDETHQWWWCVTKLQGQLLRATHSVRAFHHPDAYIEHFGGKSGGDHAGAKGMDVSKDQIADWFGGLRPEIIDLQGGLPLGHVVLDESLKSHGAARGDVGSADAS